MTAGCDVSPYNAQPPKDVQPHTCSRVLFKNHRVLIEDFILPSSHKCHLKHSKPCVRWQVGESELCLQVNGVAQTSIVADKQVFFVQSGDEWHLANIGPSDYRQVVFTFLQASPLRSEAAVKALLDAAIFPTDVGTELLFENEWCRVWDFSFPPGGGDPTAIHQHVMDYVFLYVGKGHPHRLIGTNPDGSIAFDSEAYDGDVQWNEITNGGFEEDGVTLITRARHGGYNPYNDAPFTEYVVELK